ncbi:MAG: ATP-binding protein [Parasphingopyxis sp.]|nr:response regulator [Sphingomonadales bacterium]
MAETPETQRPGAFETGDVRRRGMASAAAALLAILLGTLVYLVSATNAERDLAAERERQSFEIIMLTRNIGGSIARAEAALGRFVINSDRALGTMYRDEWRAAVRRIERLDRLIPVESAQQARVDRLATNVREYGTELANTAAYAVARRNWEALSLHNAAASSPHGPAIARTLEEIAGEERARLGERSTARIATTERSNLLAMLLAIAGVVLALGAIGLGWMAYRAFRDREHAHLRADDLELAVAERTRQLKQANEQLRAEAAEREAAERQLHQAQKMEALGQLTGGIAHDFNNMLAVVIGGLELAKRKLGKEGADIEQHLDNALDGAGRAAELTRRLLGFARSEPLQPEGIDAGEMVEEMAKIFNRALGEQIELGIDADEDIWPVWADRNQLENAVLNLAVNGRDAMEGKGVLTIAIRNITADAAHRHNGLKPGDYLEISVTDEGCGMSEQVRERAFEPFFTTKPVGRGTGLGLSQIFGFARESGGDVAIRSALEEGTTVSIFLPRFDGDAARRPSPDASMAAQPSGGSGSHCVLVVEDDARVRRATLMALEELGHDPIGCGGGAAALDVLSERDDIDLVITDIVMPGMTGLELASELAKSRPDLPLFFVTGFAGDGDESEQLSEHEVLRKPFTLSMLADAIDRAMEEAEANESVAG